MPLTSIVTGNWYGASSNIIVTSERPASTRDILAFIFLNGPLSAAIIAEKEEKTKKDKYGLLGKDFDKVQNYKEAFKNFQKTNEHV